VHRNVRSARSVRTVGSDRRLLPAAPGDPVRLCRQGDARPDSDLDLLVVLDDDVPADKLTYRAGMEARRPYKEPADMIACRRDTFRRFSRVVGTLPYAARTEVVVVVYEWGVTLKESASGCPAA